MIYNWQFVHSLDFWSRVLSSHCNSLLEAQQGKRVTATTADLPGGTDHARRNASDPNSDILSSSLPTHALYSYESPRPRGPTFHSPPRLLEVLNSPDMRKHAKGSNPQAIWTLHFEHSCPNLIPQNPCLPRWRWRASSRALLGVLRPLG